ncbi:MAG: nucleoside-diphosphate sugar epimerase/dehydratase [Massilibacteroides sp.]|nr:nucleoside-diphosphate sugar epimerase/dehydratase [Massilibacteroides sp.]
MSLFLSRILSRKYLSRWLILSFDLLLSALSTLCAVIFAGFLLSKTYGWQQLFNIGAVAVLASLASFYLFRTYKGVIRHSSFSETGRIGAAVLFKVLILLAFTFFVLGSNPSNPISLSATLDLLITFFVLTTFRVALIEVYNQLVNVIAASKDHLLILKSNKHDNIFLRSPAPDRIGKYRMAGFLQTGRKESLRVGGYQVYTINNFEEFNALVNKQFIKAVLFMDEHSVKEESERLVLYCEQAKVRMLILPAVNELSQGRLQNRQLPEVRVEDLLSRDEIEINLKEIEYELEDKVVMVTGAAGSIGSEICRQLCTFPIKQLVLFDSAETPMHNLRLELSERFSGLDYVPVLGDVRNNARVEAIMNRYRPQIIFHAAAYKHVPLMEENPCEAVRTNVYGTRIVADSAIKFKAEKFVMISTDKAVNPTNVMGASKRVAEMYVQSLNRALKEGLINGETRFITTRFGNVLGSNGSVIPLFRAQIAKGGPVTVTHPDIIRYFMTIPEACRLVLEAGTMGQGGEIFVFDMGEPVKIADLAKRMIRLAGLEPDVDIDIKYTGLRPGEKLYEEVLSDQETTLPTPYEKIRVAGVRDCDYQTIAFEIEALIKSAHTSDTFDTVRKMKAIVPEFISKNSIFEKLDKAAQKAV